MPEDQKVGAEGLSAAEAALAPGRGGDKPRSPWLRYLSLTAGLVLAGWLLTRYADAITTSLNSLGWSVLLYLLGSGLGHVINTVGWRTTITLKELPFGFWPLLGSRLSGEAVNKITPIAPLGGEPLKAYLLMLRGLTAEKAILSVILSRYAMTVAQIGFILTGVVFALVLLPKKQPMLAGFAVFPLIVLGMITAATVADLGFRRLRPTPEETQQSGPLGMWREAGQFFWRTPGALLLAVLWFFAGWCAGVGELLIASQLLQMPLSVPEAIAFEGLLVSLNMATFFIPGNAGSQEGGFVFLAPLFGLSPAEGVTLAVLRRLRDVVWILLGLGYAGWVRRPETKAVEVEAA